MKRFLISMVGALALIATGCSDDTDPVVAQCSPACGPCQTCDPATNACVDNCGDETICQNEVCVAKGESACSPACGDCEMCDTTGDTPVCTSLCATGTECKEGACVSTGTTTDVCEGACSTCETCYVQDGKPVCFDACNDGLYCDTTANVCRVEAATMTFDHSQLTSLQNFGTLSNQGAGNESADAAINIPLAKAVTATCITCHTTAADDMAKTAHWKWMGLTPNVKGKETGEVVGKKNLVNNFCVAVPSNEGRCAMCHAGYGWKDENYDFSDKTNMDCLVCHAKTNYAKVKFPGGAPDPTKTDLNLAAQSVGKPTIAACGRCHFGAGGGDNVKKGDLGSALKTITAEGDVHMGSDGQQMTCSDCHRSSSHKILGQGVHLPISEGRLACVDCHSDQPHTSAKLNNHSLDIACQTCHIPAFSRQQPTKMDWDWSTAGNMDRNTESSDTMIAGQTVQTYNWMKGDFVWGMNVRPKYAWYNGGVERITLDDQYAQAGTEADPIMLAQPTATFADKDAKIFPFKVMAGRQPVYPKAKLVITPDLWGPGGFWATAKTITPYDQTAVDALWTTVLSAGSKIAGQVTADFTGKGTGDNQWDWAYTKMYMGINHEVAKADDALGCGDCHGADKADWDWEALGYSCDPMSNDPATCGVRNPE